jgi:hypothetical protein
VFFASVSAVFVSAAAGRVERSGPVNPIVTRRWCSTSARIRPRRPRPLLDLAQERLDQPSPPGRGERVPPGITDRDITVNGLLMYPDSAAAEWAQRVRSNDSKISMMQPRKNVPGPGGSRSLSST